MAIYTGINDTAHKVQNVHVGVNGIARKVVKAWVGVNGIARLFYEVEEVSNELPYGTLSFTLPSDTDIKV